MSPQGAAPSRQIEPFFQISLVLLVASGYFSILFAGRLDPFMGALMAAALVARLLQALDVYHLRVPKPIPTVLAAAYLCFYALDVFFVSGQFIDATVRMMFFFTALKLVTAKTGRDYFYLGLLVFLQLLTASMFVAGVGFLGVLMTFLFLAVTTYVAFEIKRGCDSKTRMVVDSQPRVRRRLSSRLAALAAAMALGILVLSVGLFLVLPRVIGRTPVSPLRADVPVGFAAEVDLGLTGSLEPDYSPVMRVEALTGGHVAELRWRGLALRRFDGVRWSNPAARPVKVITPRSGRYALPPWWRRSETGRNVHYRVTLEPLSVNALFLAGLPEQVDGTFDALFVSETDSLSVRRYGLRPLRYEVRSWVSDRSSHKPANVAEIWSERFREMYLQLPRLDPRIPALATRLAGTSVPPLRRAEALEDYLRTRYGYTLDLPDERSADPLAHFLFERRKGHCEYFASAMTVMLRSLGIPARLVSGFAGGVHNPISGLHVIRSRDAHTWVEAYINRYGWLEFDPTPPDPNVVTNPYLARVWMYWDAVQSAWSEWILDYDLAQQLVLARAVHNRSRSAVFALADSIESGVEWASGQWENWTSPFRESNAAAWRRLLTGAVAATVLLMALIWSGWWLVPRLMAAHRRRRLAAGRGRPSDCSYFYQRAIETLRRRGIPRQPWQTPEEFAASVRKIEFRGLVEQITAAYNAARFGHDPEAEQRLPRLVRALEKAQA